MKDWRGNELVIRDPTAMFIRGEQYCLPRTVHTELLTNRDFMCCLSTTQKIRFQEKKAKQHETASKSIMKYPQLNQLSSRNNKTLN